MTPLRVVVDAKMRSGRGGLLGPDTARRVRWWDLTLECGHTVQRYAKYAPRTDGRPRWVGRSPVDALPHQERARCEECGRTA